MLDDGIFGGLYEAGVDKVTITLENSTCTADASGQYDTDISMVAVFSCSNGRRLIGKQFSSPSPIERYIDLNSNRSWTSFGYIPDYLSNVVPLPIGFNIYHSKPLFYLATFKD